MEELNKLLKIIKQLRDPDKGCPWDRKQTAESLKEYIIEEAHELVEAIETKSSSNLKEELGDLLLQILLISQINQENNSFSFKDVAKTLSKKLVIRHPHVFGDIAVQDADEVKQNWERIKKKEKNGSSIISNYPSQMPSLSKAKRISEQAASVGFDWENPLQALAKVEEEIAELRNEIEANDSDRINEELGDILFAIANVARLCRINPEFSLQQANKKFVERFRYIERQLASKNKDLHQTTLKEMEQLWQQSKLDHNL